MKTLRELVQQANALSAALLEAQDRYVRKPSDSNKQRATEAAEQYIRFQNRTYARFVRELTKCIEKEDAQ